MAKDGVKKVKVTKTITKVVESSDDSSSEDVPVIANKGKATTKANQKVVKAKKVVAESSSDSDSDDTPVVKAAPKKAAKAAKAAPVKKAQESSDDSDDSSDSEAEKKVVKKVVVTKKAKKVVEESSDDSSEEEEKPVKKAVQQKKAKKVVQESSDDSSSEEEQPVKKAVQKKQAKKVVEESSDDDSSEEEEKPAKKAAAPKKQSKQIESSSDDDEEEEEQQTNGKAVKEEKPVQKQQEKQNGGETLAQNNGKWEAMVRGLSYEADENDIGNWFEEQEASVEAVKLLRDRESGKSRGMAFVTFEQEDGLRKAISLNSSEHMGRTIYISNSADKDRAQRPDNQQRGSTLPEGAVTCFIGNLSYKCTDKDLRSFFASCGNILGARIATSRDDGRSRGFGHVDFDSQETANKALAFNGQDFQGRPIKVDVAEKKQGGGGQRGGFGGNRGGRPGLNLSNNDKAAKKGTIVAFQGSKKTL